VYSKNTEKERLRSKKYREVNHEKELARSRRYYQANAEEVCKRTRQYEKNNPEKVREQKRRYIENNPRILEYRKDWANRNKDKVRAAQRRHNRKVLATKRGRLHNRMCSRMNKCLKGGKQSKRWVDLTGYSIKDLENRLNKTMPEGFTWKDFMDSKLEIDHIIPISAFNFKTYADIDFKKAWALSNLQLLPKVVNRKKSDSLDKPFQPSLAFGGAYG